MAVQYHKSFLQEVLNGLKTHFIKNYYEDSDIGYILEVDVECPEELHELHNDLTFLLERMKIGKVLQLVANLIDKKEYVVNIEIYNKL